MSEDDLVLAPAALMPAIGRGHDADRPFRPDDILCEESGFAHRNARPVRREAVMAAYRTGTQAGKFIAIQPFVRTAVRQSHMPEPGHQHAQVCCRFAPSHVHRHLAPS